MSKNALTASFSRAAAKVLLGVTLILATSGDTYAQEQPRRNAPDTTRHAAPSTDTLTVVTWGDSIGNGIGNSLSGSFNRVVNLGRDGAGLTIPNKPQPPRQSTARRCRADEHRHQRCRHFHDRAAGDD